ncbi:Phospholipase/carboxylesterase [Armillaria gallica]|uniref:Acyl-protein thioesterase 1 n=1 Tax=Armillaria gallica TaxID=47427 RepID=A0A2H3CNU8_ARMGA|nr:Phospholipase/carboxylesterase [Armillaria gallica]
MAQELDCQTVLAKSKHSATVIFLHGLGSGANNIGRLARSIAADPRLHHIKWIMPQAPLRRCLWLDGAVVPAWYNVGGDGPEDEEGVTQSVKSLSQIVVQEHENGIERVLLGGFSQGDCMSLFMGVTLEDLRVAGIVMLSGTMVLPYKLIEGITSRTKNIPVFIAHGTDDDVLTLGMNAECVEALKGAGFRITENTNAVEEISYHLYQGLAHSVDLSQEVDDLKDWLKKNVPEDPIFQSSGQW